MQHDAWSLLEQARRPLRGALVSGLMCALLLPHCAVQAQEQRQRRPTAGEYNDPAVPAQRFGGPVTETESATLRTGTLIILQMLTPLSSKNAQPADRFRGRVVVPVLDTAGRTLIPVGSTVEGHVDDVEPARMRRRSGVILVSFDTLVLPGNKRYPLVGDLAPATAEDRKRFDDEGVLKPRGNSFKRNAAFIGGGAGAGALVGAFTAGAVLGAGVGAGVGVFAALMAKGKEATVEPGDRFGVELTQPLRVDPTLLRNQIVTQPSALEPYRGDGIYYPDEKPRANPPVVTPNSGRTGFDDAPITVYDPFNRTGNNPTNSSGSGGRTNPPPVARPTPRPTAPAGNTGSNKPYTPPRDTAGTQLVTLRNVLAERVSDGNLRVSLTGTTPSAGWQLAPTYTIERDVLNVQLRGIPPSSPNAQVLTTQNKLIVVADPERQVRRVFVRGANGTQLERAVIVRGGGGTASNNSGSNAGSNPGSNAGAGASSGASGVNTPAPLNDSVNQNALRITDKLNGLTDDYAAWMRALRRADGTFDFENSRDGGTPEAQFLFALARLEESANVFRQPLTVATRQRALREMNNGATQVNRLVTFTRTPADLLQRWQAINRDINQLVTQAGVTAPVRGR